MDALLSSMDSMPATPTLEVPHLTISPAATSLDPLDTKVSETKAEEKKPVKKRKSWGQELPTPKTNLPPRFVALIPLFLDNINR
jgi:transcriptional activator HAC1